MKFLYLFTYLLDSSNLIMYYICIGEMANLQIQLLIFFSNFVPFSEYPNFNLPYFVFSWIMDLIIGKLAIKEKLKFIVDFYDSSGNVTKQDRKQISLVLRLA